MLVALFILCILFFLYRVSSSNANTIKVSNPWIWIALIISLTQIILGTQVRESVDALLHAFDRSQIIQQLPFVFELHRSLACLVIISNLLVIFHYRQLFNSLLELKIILLTLFILLISGIVMSYYKFMGFAQLMHLISAMSLFMCQYSLILKWTPLPILRSP